MRAVENRLYPFLCKIIILLVFVNFFLFINNAIICIIPVIPLYERISISILCKRFFVVVNIFRLLKVASTNFFGIGYFEQNIV